MNKYIEQVKEFHENFNHPINDQKDHIDVKIRELRLNLLFEELEELSQASGISGTFHELCQKVVDKQRLLNTPNLVDKKEELDALCDIQYVLSGGILALGFHDVFDEAFDEVHNSNMSKMCKTPRELNETQEYYLNQKNTESYSVKKGDKWIVLRKGDDKVLKNIFYKEAKLDKFLK